MKSSQQHTQAGSLAADGIACKGLKLNVRAMQMSSTYVGNTASLELW